MYNLKFFLFLLAVTLWILHSFGQAYALPLYGGAEYAPTPTGTLLSQRILLPTATSVPTATAAAERSDEGRIELPIPAEQLPQPIFYLNLAGQIGYLDFDSHVQLTSEAAPITAFDVSPIDQRLVYVTNNALIELDWTSGKKVIKTTAISLDEADNKAVADKQLISAPRYSPDGSQITYIQNGVKLIAAGLDVATPPQDLLFDTS